MNKEKYMSICPLCGQQYQFGPGRYERHKLNLYGGIFVCDSCWNGNADGWVPHKEEILLNYLKQKSLPVPERNAKGWLPRDN